MEKINKKLGIFILNYNGLKWIKKNLSNIIEYSKQASITIIDNNSQDESKKYIQANFPSVKLITHKINYGFAKGYNKVLLNNTSYDYFIIMNNDIRVTKNWLDPIIHLIKKQDVGIVQPKIMNSIHTDKFDYAGAAGGCMDILGIPFCRGRILNNTEKDLGQYNHNTEIFWASGCCLAIKSKLFQQLNGFDNDFFMHQEEIDLCWRTQSTDQKIYYCAQSTIYHYGGGTLEEGNPIKHYYNHRNNLLLLMKNLPIPSLIIILPLRLLMDYLISIYYFANSLKLLFLKLTGKKEENHTTYLNKLKICILILIAHISFMLLLPKFFAKRTPIRRKNIHKSSVILDYLLSKKNLLKNL